ncbi:WSC-domain-containing protein [Marasmius fiardii PR-910]|nr:WSC-domain-containing protein [Marasmius fiardii PR-910]
MGSSKFKATVLIAIYLFTDATASPTTSTTGPVTVQQHGPWNHLGCFTDTQDRILPVPQNDCGSKNSVEYCLDLCGSQGYPFAGVEYGGECYCGKEFNPSSANECPNGCTMSCPGNAGEICGGVYAISIYERADVVKKCGEWQVRGEPDWHAGRPRNLPHTPNVQIPVKEMTVEKCLAGCADSGYTCAGVEYGQECWCGDCTATDFTYALTYDMCYMGCTGDRRELCGGGEGNGWEVIYTREPHGGSGGGTGGGSGGGGTGGGGSGGGSGGGGGDDGGWTLCGCYEIPLLSGVLDLILPVVEHVVGLLTVEHCQAVCLAKGYHGCSIESGNTCRCTSSGDGLLTALLGLLHLEDGKCNAKCPGDSAETCGGKRAFQAYTYARR